jgi:hypothetical protein
MYEAHNDLCAWQSTDGRNILMSRRPRHYTGQITTAQACYATSGASEADER